MDICNLTIFLIILGHFCTALNDFDIYLEGYDPHTLGRLEP